MVAPHPSGHNEIKYVENMNKSDDSDENKLTIIVLSHSDVFEKRTECILLCKTM